MDIPYEVLLQTYMQADACFDVEGRAACAAAMVSRMHTVSDKEEWELLGEFLDNHFNVVFLATMQNVYMHNGKVAEYYLRLLAEKYYPGMCASYYYWLGRACYEQKNWAVATKYLEKHIKEYSDDELAHFFLGNCYYKQKRYMQAIMEYQRAVDINNNFTEPFLNLRYTLQYMNDIHLFNERDAVEMQWELQDYDIKKVSEDSFSYLDIPIFINSRDRQGGLQQQVDWLQDAGYRNIHILDNQSTYPKLLDYYDKLKRLGVKIWYLPFNYGYKAVWNSNILNILKIDTPYIYTDSDVVPDENCPGNVVEIMLDILQRHRYLKKVGLTLHVDDITFYNSDSIQKAHFYMKQVKVQDGYFQQTDTTFALYRNLRHYSLRESFRTSDEYMARHIPWYYDYDNLPEDEKYYMQHADTSSSTTNVWKQRKNQWPLGGDGR